MGKSFRDNDFSDRDAQLEPDFYADAEAIAVEDVPTSELELSDEEIAAPTVSVRFNSDGFAEEFFEETEPVTNRGLLEPLNLRHKYQSTEWACCFAEIMARVSEMVSTSKLSAIRYEARGAGLKVSSLPSAIDFAADVQIVARKAMSPAMYKIFKEIYLDGFGKKSNSIPESVQIAIQQKAGLAWKISGIHPWGEYWTRRVNLEKVKEVILVDLDIEENRKAKLKADRNARRRERRSLQITALAA